MLAGSPLRPKVGVRLVDWTQGFGHRLYGGILDFIRAGHPMQLVFHHPSGGDLPPEPIRADWEGDGLLVFRPTLAETKAWLRRGIKGVNLSTETPAGLSVFPRVTLDNVLAGRMAAEHLLGLGLRRFAFLHDPHRLYSRERLEGFRKGLHAAGYLPEVVEIPVSRYKMSTRARQFHEMLWRCLARFEAPTGLFARDDIAAVAAVRALERIGLRVPEDMPVLGVADDIVYCHATTPPLSSLRFPGKAIGRAAADLLHRQLSGERVSPHERLTIPPRGVVQRESTGRVELPDPVVTRAIAAVQASLLGGSPPTATELARTLGVSREALRLRFQDTLGRSPKQEIDRLRAERIGDILRRGDWTLEKIADDCGFGGSDELCRFFKRVKGVTTGEWKKG